MHGGDANNGGVGTKREGNGWKGGGGEGWGEKKGKDVVLANKSEASFVIS